MTLRQSKLTRLSGKQTNREHYLFQKFCLKAIATSNSLTESLASLCTQFVVNLSVCFAEVQLITVLPEKTSIYLPDPELKLF